MALKLLVALCLVQVVIINAQLNRYNPAVENLLRNVSRPGPADSSNCDTTVCSPPCPGAYPPFRCPSDIPPCHFGCACHTDCERGVVICFETKHCLQVGRFFTARRRAKMS